MSEKKLRVLVVGASGTIGKAVVTELSQRHEIVTAGSKSGDVQINIEDVASIEAGLAKVGKIDALVVTAGSVDFKPLVAIEAAPLEESVYALGLRNKLMGQVNLALAARKHLNDGGSITLISGILSDDPILYGSSASMVNGALNSFVIHAATELPRGLRINIVSPTVLTESLAGYGPFFRGFPSVDGSRVAMAFSKSVEGIQTGKVYAVNGN